MVSCGYSADDIKIIKSISQSVDGTSNNVVYKKNDNNNASFMNCLLTRERTINGGPYSYSVPVQILYGLLPSLKMNVYSGVSL